MSADPLVQAPRNSQSYNRYSYVFNNPLSFTDPTGYKTEDTSKCEKKDELDVCPKGAQPTEKDKDDGTTAEDRRLMMQHQMTLWGYNADTNPRNADIWNPLFDEGVLVHSRGAEQEGGQSLGTIASGSMAFASASNEVAMCQAGVCLGRWLGKNGEWYSTLWGGWCDGRTERCHV